MAHAIRLLGPGDERLLAQIARDAPDFDLPGRSVPDAPLEDAAAASYLADPGVRHWIAEAEGRVAGELLCHVIALPHAPGRELLLYSIGVRSADRGSGCGRALVAAMRSWAAAEGIALVWVLADNPGAERFYEACGFVRGGEHDQGVLLTLDVAG